MYENNHFAYLIILLICTISGCATVDEVLENTARDIQSRADTIDSSRESITEARKDIDENTDRLDAGIAELSDGIAEVVEIRNIIENSFQRFKKVIDQIEYCIDRAERMEIDSIDSYLDCLDPAGRY